jgi:hypothetical protein
MKDAGVWWQLDGSLNIAFWLNRYLGVHADIDMSVRRDELPQFEGYLAQRGYGLFLLKRERDSSTGMTTRRIFRRVGARNFRHDGVWAPRIVAVDERGEIRQDTDLVMVEVEMLESESKDGLLATWIGWKSGWQRIHCPDEWLRGEVVDFHGVSITLSHPARFLFHKIACWRGYDEADVDALVESHILTPQDVVQVEQLYVPILKWLERGVRRGEGAPMTLEVVQRRLLKLKQQIE